MPDFEVATVTTATEMLQALAVRRRVFIEEQGVPEAIEIDQHDGAPDSVADCRHVVLTINGRPVATGRIIFADEDGRTHIGRIAVLAKHRGRGCGRAVMEALHEIARRRGLLDITLGAQLHAIGFYERLGYAARGDVFLDAGIEHRWMDVRLRGAVRGEPLEPRLSQRSSNGA